MIGVGFTLLLLGSIALFLIGLYSKTIKDFALYIIFAVIVLLKISGILILSDGVEKCTLLDYENGGITYKVTEIRVKDNKATDIEVIHHPNTKETE